MKTEKIESNSLWIKAPVANLVRYEPTGIYAVRAKVRGKLIRKSLETNVLSVAKLRLADVLDAEHKAVASSAAKIVGKMSFGDALDLFKERQKNSTEIKARSKDYNLEITKLILKTWAGLEAMDIRKVTKQDCLSWRNTLVAKYSAQRVNSSLSILRRTLDIGLEAGVRYDNPARAPEIKRARVRPKELKLPETEQFVALVKCVQEAAGRFSKDCADAMEFFAYSGTRVSEAACIFGRDCSFTKGQIVIRGDAETGTKNWEIRRIPMIPEMHKLLERLRTERGEEEFLNNPVLKVREFQKALTRACKKIGITRITHHDLRHLFATHCIESSVDIPTVSRWLGHKDGGVLAMKTYGHLRDRHSSDMAEKVVFHTETQSPVNAVESPKPPTSAPAVSTPDAEIARTKAKYRYPWWASPNPVEVFWGQVHEKTALVSVEVFQRSAVAAMKREVFPSELQDKESLAQEFRARVDAPEIEKLAARVLNGCGGNGVK